MLSTFCASLFTLASEPVLRRGSEILRCFVTIYLAVLLSSCSVTSKKAQDILPANSAAEAVATLNAFLQFNNKALHNNSFLTIAQIARAGALRETGDFEEGGRALAAAAALLEKAEPNVLRDQIDAMYQYQKALLHLAEGDYTAIKEATRDILRLDDSTRQHKLLRDAFSIIHAVHTGDAGQAHDVFVALRVLNEEREKNISLLDLHWRLEVLIDRAIIDMFLSYASLQRGSLRDTEQLQRALESLEQSLPIHGLLGAGHVLGIFKEDRAFIYALAGYGYSSVLGKHEIGLRYLKYARETLGAEDALSSRGLMLLAGATAVALDARLVSGGLQDAQAAEEEFTEVTRILDKAEALTWKEYGALRFASFDMLKIVRHYVATIAARLRFLHGTPAELSRHVTHVLPIFDRTSPKPLLLELAYYPALALKQGSARSDCAKEAAAIAERVALLVEGYTGYELWKLHVAISIVSEINGSSERATTEAQKAVEIVEKYSTERFADLAQQLTFAEDGGGPYKRLIDVLVARYEDGQTQGAEQLLEVIERSKARTLQGGGTGKRDSVLPAAGGPVRRPATQHALVSLYYTQEYLVTILLKTSGPPVVRVARGVDLKDVVGQFANAVSSDWVSREQYVASGYKVYQATLEHFANELNGIRRIALSPHGDLHLIPWSGVSTKSTNSGSDFLIDRYALSIATSFVTMSSQDATNGTRELGRCSVALLAGTRLSLSDFDDFAVTSSCGIRTDNRGRPGAALAALEKDSLVVIYAHGVFNENLITHEAQLVSR